MAQVQTSLCLDGMDESAGNVMNSVEWIKQFVSQDEQQSYLNYAYCDGAKLIGTNGVILATLPNTELEKGYYHCDTMTLANDVCCPYPNPDRIIPNFHRHSLLDVQHEIETYNDEQLYVYAAEDFEVALRKEYVDKVLNNPSAVENVLARSGNSCVLWKFVDGSLAVVMPFDRNPLS